MALRTRFKSQVAGVSQATLGDCVHAFKPLHTLSPLNLTGRQGSLTARYGKEHGLNAPFQEPGIRQAAVRI